MGISGTAIAASLSIAVNDVAGLSKNSAGFYTGGGAVHIGGSDISYSKEGVQGNYWWEGIYPYTPGLSALQNLAGSEFPIGDDINYPLNEADYQRVMHGERLVTSVAEKSGYSTPVGVVSGLNMGTAENRYQKVQNVSLYQVDAAGKIVYQKDADGKLLLDKNNHPIPVIVTSNNLVLNRNSDVYIKRQERVGGQFGLKDSAIYSKVQSFGGDVAAITMNANLRETADGGRARDVFIVKNTIIDNTLDTDIGNARPSSQKNIQDDQHRHDEWVYDQRPDATGLRVVAFGVDYNRDSKGVVQPGIEHHTNVVPQQANIILDNATIKAQNLAAGRQDNHNINNGYDYYQADDISTALDIQGSGLYVSIANKSLLQGGFNNAGNALSTDGQANRIDVDNSTLNGAVVLEHSGASSVIDVYVTRDAKNNTYSVTGSNSGIQSYGPADRNHNGHTLNIKNNSIVNGDIFSVGSTWFDVRLIDVSTQGQPITLTEADIAQAPSAKTIYDNAVNLVGKTILANDKNAFTPVAINLNHSVLNGKVTGITDINYPVVGSTVSSWNADMSVTNGAVWNAAATAIGKTHEAISDVHDLNLSNSQLNLINVNTNAATLGGRGTYQDISSARVVVHGNLNQDKDANGNYQTSEITVGKASVEPLVFLGGDYVLGSVQVKGTAKGNYILNMASSGVEPYAKNGYVADSQGITDTKAHSFVNYKGTGSDAHFIGSTELGAYQYDVVDEANDNTHDERNVYFKSTGQLSNSAATAMSMDASMVNVATMETDNLREHMAQSRHASDEGGVWVSYFGGKNINTTSGGAGYDLQTNGVMLGMDNVFDAKKGGNWLAGLAFSSARSDLDVRNSQGDLDSYGAQFYLSRRWDNGIFVDTSAQFNHFNNSTKVRMLDGQRAHKDYSSNGYGLGMKVGYTWSNDGFFAEPYIAATGRTFDGAHYTLNNGMVVDGDDYKSMLGELGAQVGYTFDLDHQNYVKPYFHLAGLNEFADSNKMKINNKSLDNSVDGAAVQVGLGVEAKVMKDFGGYASFNYTGGDNMERPWEARVGVNYTW